MAQCSEAQDTRLGKGRAKARDGAGQRALIQEDPGDHGWEKGQALPGAVTPKMAVTCPNESVTRGRSLI